MKKLFILFSFIFFSFNYSFADCITGYACSIKSLHKKNIEQENKFIKDMNDYFKLSINEDFMLGIIKKDLKYKDFFPFSIMLD